MLCRMNAVKPHFTSNLMRFSPTRSGDNGTWGEKPAHSCYLENVRFFIDDLIWFDCQPSNRTDMFRKFYRRQRPTIRQGNSSSFPRAAPRSSRDSRHRCCYPQLDFNIYRLSTFTLYTQSLRGWQLRLPWKQTVCLLFEHTQGEISHYETAMVVNYFYNPHGVINEN